MTNNMSTPDKCPHCGAIRIEGREYACGYIFRQNVRHNPRTYECLLNSERAAHAATRKELEEMRASVKKFEPYYLDYISSVSAAGLPADGPCLACNGFGGHEEGCHGTTGLMTMAYELETLRARVRELEKWKLAAKAFWRAVMSEDDPDLMPAAMLQVSNLIEQEKQTLGEAMPRKSGI